MQVPNAAALHDMSLVKIDDEEFSLLRIPPENCALVLKQKEQILGSIDLAVFVDHFGRIGNFVRLAYNGVVGHVELQDTIRRISCDVTELCDKSCIPGFQVHAYLHQHPCSPTKHLCVLVSSTGRHGTGEIDIHWGGCKGHGLCC